MSKKLINTVRRRLLSGSRGIAQRLQPDTAPLGLPQTREGALSEPDAVNLSVQFPGWLNVPASIVTLHLIGVLPFGPIVEIGVYRGKYLSILRAGAGETCRILGYDIFDENQVPEVEAQLTQAFGTLGNIKLIQIDSTRLTPERVLRDCGASPVFMSVDGSHEAAPVLSDMRLADAVLADAGIVAMDDVLNPLALGVNEAVARFLSGDTPALVPFAYVANKMLFCRPDRHAAYQQQIAHFLAGRGDDPSFGLYVEHMKKNEDLRRRFFGHDVLIVTG